MKRFMFVVALLAMIAAAGQAAQVAKYSFEQNLSDTASSGTADTLVGMKTYPGNALYGDESNWQAPIYDSIGVSGYAVRLGAGTPGTPPTVGAMCLTTTGDSADLSLAGGVFTMEGFFKADILNEYPYVRLITKWVSGFTPGYHFAIHNNTFEILYRNSGNTAHATVLDDQTLTQLGVSAGTWFHLAATGDGATLTLWLNGTAIASGSQLSYTNDSTSPFYIGGRTDMTDNPTVNNNAFKGLVDEVIVWTEAKDATYMTGRAALAAAANLADKKAKLPTPINGAMSTTPATPTLTWSSNATSPTYKLYMGTDPNALTTKVYEGTTASYTAGALLQNTKYYWRVDVIEGSTPYTGDVWNFTTSYAILTNLPATNSKSQDPAGITLSWTSIGTSPTYDVYFGTDPNALSLASNDQTGTSYATGTLAIVTDYYWRVDVTVGSDSFEGQVNKFVTGGKVTASYPGNGGFNVDNDAIFKWTGEATLATAYDVYLGTSSSAVASATTASPMYMGRISHPTQEWQVTSSMSYNTTYYWRVDEVIGGVPVAGDVKGFLVRTVPTVKLYWPLDGNADDSTANGNDGYVYGDISFETGLLGQCANIQTALSDITCYAAVNLPYDVNDCWSMNMFVNIPSELVKLTLIGGFGSTANNPEPAAEARYFMYYDIDDPYRPEHDNVMHFYFWTGRGYYDVEASKTWTLNEWNMLTTTYDAYSKTIKMYLNGYLVASRQYYPCLTSVRVSYQDVLLAPTSIWVDHSGGGEFIGKIDEFKIYYSTLNGTEVQDLLPWAYNPTPADDSNAITLSPVLTWEGNAAATGYTLKYGTSLDSNGDIVSPTVVSGLTTAGYSLADLDVNTVYYWTVDSAVTGYGTVSVPEVWSFTTGGNCVDQPASDLNGDCKVNFADLDTMHDEWLNDGRDEAEACINQPLADIDGDCVVNFMDYVELAIEWTDCGFDLQELCD